MVDTIRHLRAQHQAATGLLRVLRPQRLIVMAEPNPEALPVRPVALAEKLILMRSCFSPPKAVQGPFAATGGQARLEWQRLNVRAMVEKPG
jgi:hypothetical protein